MAEPIRMPRQGQSVETCIITQWYKQKGDKVEEGDILFSYETDKAAFDETAGLSGILLEKFFQEGDEVRVLETVAIIGEENEDISGLKETIPEAPKEVAVKNETKTAVHDLQKDPVEKRDDSKIRISPRARRMAADLKINISDITGTGPNGRIIARDIESFDKGNIQPANESEPVTYGKSLNITDEYTDHSTSNIRRIIAKNMKRSLENSAQLTHHSSADARKILQLRSVVKAKKNTDLPETTTLNDMVCFAIVRVLSRTPDMNAHFLDTKIRTFSGVHLGIAVDTDRGLMVPVLRNADRFTLGGLGKSLRELAASCKDGTIDPDLLNAEAGTFTVANLGIYGIEMFTPVLNLPQCGIMGVNTILPRPADTGDGTIGFVPHIGLSLTYDHRAIDGAPASKFLKEVCDFITEFDPKQ